MLRHVLTTTLALGLAACSLIVPGPDDFTYDLNLDAGPTDSGIDAGLDAAPVVDAGCPMMCGGACTDTSTDPAHCGSCDRSCFAPDDGTATCVDGSCGFTCDLGFELVLGICVARVAPRPIAPLSTASVTSRRPTLRWEIAPRSDGARVELCADRACMIVLQTIDAPGNSAAPSMDLPAGVVFWRLFARSGADVGTQPSPTWQLHVGVRTAAIDTSWGTTLDVNGDGFTDAIVGAPRADGGSGRMHVYHGGASGLATAPATTLAAPDGGFFGASVASAGDVNGDGFADVIIGAWTADGRGRAYVYHGGAGGLATTPATTLISPGLAGDAFGWSVASAGDVNGDGFADVIVGAVGLDSAAGGAYIYHGGIVGLATAPATVLTAPDGVGGQFGWSVASVGDVNGDGFADVIVGASQADSGAGRAYVYHGGGGGGLGTTPATTLIGPDGMNGEFGASVASAGDVNGDGFADAIVGAQGVGSFVGRAYVYHGGVGGLAIALATTLAGPDGVGGAFGRTVASAGDVNADGFADVSVGAPAVDSRTGRAYVYHGGVGGLAIAPATALTGPDGMNGDFGHTVASAGDVNGDGFADISVGAPTVDSRTGRAYIYQGGRDGVATTPATALIGPDGMNGDFGQTVASAGLPTPAPEAILDPARSGCRNEDSHCLLARRPNRLSARPQTITVAPSTLVTSITSVHRT